MSNEYFGSKLFFSLLTHTYKHVNISHCLVNYADTSINVVKNAIQTSTPACISINDDKKNYNLNSINLDAKKKVNLKTIFLRILFSLKHRDYFGLKWEAILVEKIS